MRIAGRLAGALCGLFAICCTTTTEDSSILEASSSGDFMPEVRAAYTFKRYEPFSTGRVDPATGRRMHGAIRQVELAAETSLSRAAGSFEVEYVDGGGFPIGGGTVQPAVGDEGDYELLLYALDLRARIKQAATPEPFAEPVIREWSMWAMDGLIGVGVQSLDLEIQGRSENQMDVGMHLGLRGEWRPIRAGGLFGSFGAYFGFGGNAGNTLTLDGGVAVHLGNNVALQGGWRFAAYSRETSESELNLSASGPFAALVFDF